MESYFNISDDSNSLARIGCDLVNAYLNEYITHLDLSLRGEHIIAELAFFLLLVERLGFIK